MPRLLEWPAEVVVTDLPLQATSIVGRSQELGAARQRLLSGDVRLLTLTGPPGVGKTRVALALASDVRAEFPAGVRFVDLAPIGDPQLVIDAIARTLGLRDVDRRVALEVVEEFLRDKSVLLILDNFEHLLDAASVVGRLLAVSPLLKVVATSRAPLHLGWERELAIPPLEVPVLREGSTADEIAASPAAQLFIERAQAVSPDFVLSDADAAAVAEICALLDGLPLAIELAAARVKLFPPRALLRRLRRAPQAEATQESALRLLAEQARDLPSRHQTLLGAIAWSYDLLDQDEQAVFRRLSVFIGGCSLEAAEAVAVFNISHGLEVIASLIDKSLVLAEQQPDGDPRLRLLETIAEYARERFASSDELDAVRARHAAYYLDLVELAAREFVGPHQQPWFARLERERANLQAVEGWARKQRQVDVLVRLWAAMWPFWLAREDASQARDRLGAFLGVMDQMGRGPALARAIHGAGLMAEKLGDYVTCRALLQQGVALARELPDRRALAALLDSLGRQEFIEGRYEQSRPLLVESEAILVELDDRVGLARVLSHLGFLEHLERRPAAARAIFERGLALAVAVEDRHRVAEFMDNLGNTYELEGHLESAIRMFQEAIAIWRDLGQGHWLAMALNNLGKVEIRRAELDSAREHLHEALRLAHRMGNRRRLAYALSAIAEIEAAEGDADWAAKLDAIASATVAELGARQPVRTRRPSSDQSAAPSVTLTLEGAVQETMARLAARPMTQQPTEPDTGPLTRRERDVAALLARGLTNRQIAETLVLSEGTVENYVQRILGKLALNNRAQIAVWATQRGLSISPQSP